MNQHFTEAEFDICVSTSEHNLNPLRQLHLKSCATCQAVLTEQADMNTILLDLKPQRMSKDLADKIISVIKQPTLKNIRLNWLIAASLILTAILITIPIFNPQTEAHRPFIDTERLVEKLVKLQPQNIKMPELIPDETAMAGLKQITEFFNTPYTALLFFVFFVFSFYLLADQYFRKTFYKKH